MPSHEWKQCPVTCWKGDPKHPMAARAQCKHGVDHPPPHEDQNGNRFNDDGSLRLVRRAVA